ncbi:MAG: RluA family pseudouridine synthase [Anaerolineaceae bacterium]|nr:MAG: RluA family pseudouridine synthase [Anaerolineaceae bacterium]
MSETTIEFKIEGNGQRLDKLIVAHVPDLSRSQIQAMIKDGLVTVDGETVKAGVKLRDGQLIRVTIPRVEPQTIEPETDIPLNVLHEDDAIIVIDKQAHLVTHPGAGNTGGTLVNALLGRWPQIAAMDDPDGRHGIVHRLDKDTSGVMVIAKTAEARQHLMAQFQARTVEKTYIAMLERPPETAHGRIEAPIGRDPKQRKQMAVQRDGKEAITEFTVLDKGFREGATLVEFNLLTGRTHQIRVHSAFIGCPVIGDRVYGYRKQRFNRMKRNFLHAQRLSFEHPTTGERLTFTAPLPPALEQIMEKLRE